MKASWKGHMAIVCGCVWVWVWVWVCGCVCVQYIYVCMYTHTHTIHTQHTHTHTHTEAGDTPLMKASWKGHVAIVTILLADRPSHGIDEMGTFLGTR